MAKKTRSHRGDKPRRPRPHPAGKVWLAGETGYVIKPHGGRLSIALCYPNTYQIGMSNLGFQKVYHLLNRRDGVVCERAFYPSPEEKAQLQSHRHQLCSIETGLPLHRFDVIAFSITFEMDYANALIMLKLGGIGPGRPAGKPLIMAGGIAVTMNPEAMADHFDLMALGEAEGIIDPLIDRIMELRDASHLPPPESTPAPPYNGGEKETPADWWKGLARLPGVYVTGGYQSTYSPDGRFAGINPKPGFPAKVARVWDKVSMDDPNVTRIHTQDTVFGAMGLVETGKGCGRHCRFCAAGYSYRPTRITRLAPLLKAVDAALEKHGRVGLVGSAVADHPDLIAVLEHIIGRKGQFALSSMRLDRLDARFLERCWEGGIRTITAAPEAGSARLRRIINKEMDREKIIEAAALIGKTARFNLKLYFLVGLPWETGADVEDIPTLALDMRDAMVAASKERGTAGSIQAGVNGFVPKPWTPFQWAPFAGIKRVEERYKLVQKKLRGQPNITLATGSAHMDHIQAMLSMGDRRVGGFVELAAGMDGDWTAALKEIKRGGAGFDLPIRSPGDPLPWDIVDYGLRADYLEKDYHRAEKEMTIADCPPPGTKCLRCGSFAGVCAEERE